MSRDSSDGIGCGLIFGAAVIIFLVLLTFLSVNTIPAGYRGVLLTWGQITTTPLDPGLHIRAPFVNEIHQLSVQSMTYTTKASAASRDLQIVTADVAITYHLNPDQVVTIFQNLRGEYEARILVPNTQEAVKAATARYEASQLITDREKVKDDMTAMLRDRLTPYGLSVESINIVNFAFSKEFENAIEAKVTAQQQALRATNDLERIKVEAQQQIEKARADAESIRIQGDALSKNPALIELKAVEKWDGKMPTIIGGQTPFLQLPALK